MTVDGRMVAEAFSLLHLLLVFLYALHLQVLFFALMQIDASLVYGQYFLPAASQNLRNILQAFHL